MSGYIALTTPEWISSVKSLGNNTAVFWRKKKSFKAVQLGESIYFLQRGTFTSNSNRYIVGSGIFADHELLLAEEAWEKYGNMLGFPEKSLFLACVKKQYKESNPQLSCLLLTGVKLFPRSISLVEANIDFSPYIVSGKKINDDDCRSIEETANLDAPI